MRERMNLAPHRDGNKLYTEAVYYIIMPTVALWLLIAFLVTLSTYHYRE